ncbi:hypothetical protein A5719_10315 [Mycolicibacterium peregrinum]|uniref:hypothetical protein n=1 Tax=Mycolicibacterium peregrinum TaxID=43304 RepID=UPI0007EBC043|nr:hypothetical protein [Mycolicibacterium peregrinum]OBF42828.1 hypothetical protein A5719_10315 [Mycolicibacterium peregrinum]
MTITTASDVVTAAMSIADDAAQGRLDPAQLEAQAVARLRQLVGTVVGEGDPAWDLQCDIARGVLAAGGVPANELAEWLAVARHRAGEPVDQPEPDQAPPQLDSAARGAHSPENGDPAPAHDDEPQPVALAEVVAVTDVAPEPAGGRHRRADDLQPKADGYDPTRGWQPGNPRRY